LNYDFWFVRLKQFLCTVWIHIFSKFTMEQWKKNLSVIKLSIEQTIVIYIILKYFCKYWGCPINNVRFEMKISIGQNIQNKSNSILKIQALVFNGLHLFFSQFLECLVKPLFIFGSKNSSTANSTSPTDWNILQRRNWAIERNS
jgi:hypothetical protein